MAKKLLELQGVSLAFGGLNVVTELDLHVDEGEIVSVIGPNGAGKTTLFNLITGIYQPDAGEILLDGQSIVGLQPHQISRRGVARTFQTLRLFLNMTVKENVMAAAYGHTHAGRLPLDAAHARHAARGEREIEQLAEERLAFFGERLMGYRWDQPAYSLSYANRRRLEIARATATEAAAAAARRARRRHEPGGDARDHRADRAAARGRRLHDPRDRARHARRRGHLRPRRRARPRREDRRGVVRAGGDRPARSSRRTSARRRRRRSDRDPAAALARGDRHATTGRSTSSRASASRSTAGELVCLLGGNASGKSTTLKTILGIVKPRNGSVRFDGEDVTGRSTSHRIKKGMAIVPENRRLFAPMTVLENLEMGAYLHGGGTKEDFERVYELFPLLHERRAQLAGTLSGGEQQMVAMGRALMAKPKLLLMDEPSMGLAPILVERSFEIIKQVHEAGVAMLIVEQNANVSLSIADRGYVLSTGRLVLEGKADDLREDEDLRKAYLGR